MVDDRPSTTLHLRELILEVPRVALVDVIEHGREARFGFLFGALNARSQFCVDGLCEVCLFVIVPSTKDVEVLTETDEWIGTLPLVYFVLFPVCARVVGRRVSPQSIRKKFHESGAPSTYRALHGIANYFVCRERIIPIAPGTRDAVRYTFVRNGFGSGLFLGGNANRPMIVSTKEHHRNAKHTRKVHARMKVARTRRAVAKVDSNGNVVFLHFGRPCEANGLRDLCAHGGTYGYVSMRATRVVVGHLASFNDVILITKHVVDVRL
jgi:hypothetical protein